MLFVFVDNMDSEVLSVPLQLHDGVLVLLLQQALVGLHAASGAAAPSNTRSVSARVAQVLARGEGLAWAAAESIRDASELRCELDAAREALARTTSNSALAVARVEVRAARDEREPRAAFNADGPSPQSVVAADPALSDDADAPESAAAPPQRRRPHPSSLVRNPSEKQILPRSARGAA